VSSADDPDANEAMNSPTVMDSTSVKSPDDDAHVSGRGAGSNALEHIYRDHAAALFRLAYRITGTQADAEDVIHDLFVGLPELLQRYEDRGHLLPWLRAITVRIALGSLRRERRRSRLLAGADQDGRPAADPWNAIDLERAMERLPPALRIVFVLRHLEGYSHGEIAELLDTTAGAIRVRHLRALERLRAILEPR
jgi:RNA polymerase sigma-70 factor (ECF subfamily)